MSREGIEIKAEKRKGQYLINSYEHDSQGFSTEDAKIAQLMANKRWEKIKKAVEIAPKYNLVSKGSKNLIVSWGSTKGTIMEAIEDLDFDFLQIKTVWPIDREIEKIMGNYKKIVVVENNLTGQLTTVLKSQFNFNPDKLILKADGRPFFPEEIINELSK